MKLYANTYPIYNPAGLKFDNRMILKKSSILLSYFFLIWLLSSKQEFIRNVRLCV